MIHAREFADGPRLIRYECGRASWHQAKAGHAFAARIDCVHSHDEHLRFMSKASPDYPIVPLLMPAPNLNPTN